MRKKRSARAAVTGAGANAADRAVVQRGHGRNTHPCAGEKSLGGGGQGFHGKRLLDHAAPLAFGQLHQRAPRHSRQHRLQRRRAQRARFIHQKEVCGGTLGEKAPLIHQQHIVVAAPPRRPLRQHGRGVVGRHLRMGMQNVGARWRRSFSIHRRSDLGGSGGGGDLCASTSACGSKAAAAMETRASTGTTSTSTEGKNALSLTTRAPGLLRTAARQASRNSPAPHSTGRPTSLQECKKRSM